MRGDLGLNSSRKSFKKKGGKKLTWGGTSKSFFPSLDKKSAQAG